MKIEKVQTNFTSGELDSSLGGRTDLPLYANGLARARDVRLMPGGGLRRRAGLAHAFEIETIAYQHEPWIFNAEQTYQLLFTEERVEIHDGVDGYLLASHVGCPWGLEEIGFLSVYSQGDLTFIAHPDIPVTVIRRLSAGSFAVEPFEFDKVTGAASRPSFMPFYRYARPGERLRVQLVGTPGPPFYTDADGWGPGAEAHIYTMGFDLFVPAHVGTVLRIGNAQWLIATVVDATHATATLLSENFRIQLTQNPMTISGGGTPTATVTVYDPDHVFIPGQLVNITNAVPFVPAGYIEINGVKSVVTVNESVWTFQFSFGSPFATATGGGPNVEYWSTQVATTDWQEQMYSAVHGYPHCVGGAQSRLMLGGGRDAPNRLNFSRLEAPFNFDVGTGADEDSIQVGLSGRRTPIVQNVIDGEHIQIFTSEGEYYIPRLDNTAGLTPTTISVLPSTFYGTKRGVKAVEFDGASLFVSRNGGHLRQFVASAEGGYSSPDLSFVSHHLLPSPRSLTVQMEDPQYASATAMLVDDSGFLAVLTMMRSEKVAAWSAWETFGRFKTACAIDNRAFFVVERTTPTGPRTFLEKANLDRVLDGSLMGTFVGKVGQSYVWEGFELYANRVIRLVVDGRGDIGQYTPDDDGRVSIPVRAETLEGGFSITPFIRTLPPELVLPDGPTVGQYRRVICAILKVQNTAGLRVRGNKVLNMQAQNDLGLPADLVTGYVHVHLLGWDMHGQVDITQTLNGPMELLSLALELEY